MTRLAQAKGLPRRRKAAWRPLRTFHQTCSNRRCCRTLTAKDSQHESMRLDGRHEQARARPLPHDELVRLQRFAPQSRVVLIWLDKEMAWHAPHEGFLKAFLGARQSSQTRRSNSACRLRCCSSCRHDRPPGWWRACYVWRGWIGQFRTTPRCVADKRP